MWTEPKVIEVVFRGWDTAHPAELLAAEREQREPQRPALLELDGLPRSVRAPQQLRAALEPLKVGTRVRIEYHGFKSGRTTGVKLFTVEPV